MSHKRRKRWLAALTFAVLVPVAPTFTPTAAGEVSPAAVETCRSFTRKAYAVVPGRPPGARRASLTLTVNACTEFDELDFPVIGHYQCHATTRRLRPGIVPHGGRYALFDENDFHSRMNATRCVVARDRSRVYAELRQDWARRPAGRPKEYSCPSVTIEYWAGDTTPISWVAGNQFRRFGWNGDFTRLCPAWRPR